MILRQAAGVARDADGGRRETEAEGISFRWWLREQLLTLAGGAGCSSSSEQSQLEQRETRAAGAARDAGSCWDSYFAAGTQDSCFAAGAARGRGFWSSAGRRVRTRVQPQAVAAGGARVARRERCVQQRFSCRGCRVRWMALEQREMQAELWGGSLRLRLPEQLELHRRALGVACSSSSGQLLQVQRVTIGRSAEAA